MGWLWQFKTKTKRREISEKHIFICYLSWQIRQWFSKTLKTAKTFCFSLEGKKWKKYFWSKSDWHHVIIHVLLPLHNNTVMLAEAIFEKREEEGDFYTPATTTTPQKLIVQLFSVFCLLENESPGKLGWPQHLKIPWWPGKRATT